MMRVLLADDHQLLRQALRRAFEDAGVFVVGEAADGEEASRLVDELRPDIVVMDVTMPVLDGVEATRRIHGAYPELPIVMLTMHGEAELRAEAIRAGAAAFMTKDSSMHDVVATVVAAAAGEALSPDLASTILAEFRDLRDPRDPRERTDLFRDTSTAPKPSPSRRRVDSPLTKREEEILQLIADGYSTTEVAGKLFISAKTVKNHLASIYDKLDARDRTQAVLSAVRIGIIRIT
jgi:DNA-binding NarL/FixJ family response regulator